MPLYGYDAVKKDGKGPWIFPERPTVRPTNVKSELGATGRQAHSDRSSALQPKEEDEQQVHAEYAGKLLEARAWHTPLTLPPFLPVLYSDYILDEQRTIWRYDARDRSGALDREVEGVWSTLKVKSAQDRMSGDEVSRTEEHGEVKVKKEEEDDAGLEHDVAAKAAEADNRSLKTLVRNLAERGAVRDPYYHLSFQHSDIFRSSSRRLQYL